MIIRKIALAVFIAALITPVAAMMADAAELDAERFAEHVEALTKNPHRLAGTPEGREAADYIESQLRDMNGRFMSQRFSLPQQVIEQCELHTPSGVMTLLPLRPNGMQPSVTGRAGIKGRLIYVGSRRFAPSDILDWNAFTRALVESAGSDEPDPGARIWELLDEQLKSDIESGVESGNFADDVRERFAHTVNSQILAKEDFYDEETWKGVSLRRETRRMLRRMGVGLRSHEKYPMNRLLIEDAFPETIARGFDGKDLKDAIVLADFTERQNGVELFRLGAKAVIFIKGERDDPYAKGTGRSRISINLPRFYVSEEKADQYGLVTAGEVTLRSVVHWEKMMGRNLFLYIRGTDPVFRFDREEYLILSAHYDTGGIVPYNNPGYESAANAAALLETARNLSENPPRRSVLIAFFDNHNNYMEGARHFYTALRKSVPDRIDDPLPVRQRFVEEERAFLEEFAEFFRSHELFGERHALTDRALARLSEEARYVYNSYLEELTETHIDIHRARERLAEISGELRELEEDSEEYVERIADLKMERDILEAGVKEQQTKIDPLEEERRAWQVVRESIRDEILIPESDSSARRRFEAAIENVLAQISERLDELDVVGRYVDDCIEVTSPLSNANPVGHVNFNFASSGDRWLFIPTNTQLHLRYYGNLLDEAEAAFSEKAKEELGFVWEARRTWEAAAANPDSYVNYEVDNDTIFGQVFEIPGISLVTEQDRASSRQMPDQHLSIERLDKIRKHADAFSTFLAILVDEGFASVSNTLARSRNLPIEDYIWEGSSAEGHAIRSFAYGDPEASKMEPNALVHFISQDQSKDYYVYADANAIFPWMTVFSNPPYSDWRTPQLEAAKFDDDGRIEQISAVVPGGPVASVDAGWHRAGAWRPLHFTGYYTRLTLFSGVEGRLFGRYRPLDGPFKRDAFSILEGLSDSNFNRLHFRYDPEYGAGRYQVVRPLGVKIIYKDSQNPDDVALYLNPQPDKPEGVGYGPGSGTYIGIDEPMSIDLRIMLARDLSELNMSRLVSLRERNIILNYIEYLHSQARDLLGSLEEAVAANRHTEAVTHAATVAGLERRIYNPVIDTTEDMVSAVTVLLILAIPFAFSLQSLLLPSYNIYRKITGFLIFFLFSFVLLYFTHPAFAFSATPIVIILAFIIMLMSALVIYVISGKFNYEIKKMQGLATAAHSMQQSLFGNLGAAVSLAISIMQRRPVRTILTVITVLLLTFTILSFVAFQPEQGINKFYRGPAEDQISRLMFRNKVWLTMSAPFDTWRDFMRTYYEDSYELHGRYWRTRELEVDLQMEDLYIPIRHESGRGAAAGAIMTFDDIEIERLPEIRNSILPGNIDEFLAGEGVYLSSVLEETLGVSEGEIIRIDGVDVKYLGAFDSRALASMRQIDGSPIVPISYGVSRLAIGELQERGSAGGGADPMADLQEELEQLEPEALEPVSPDTLVIAPTSMATKFNMLLKAVVVYPVSPDVDLEDLAERITVLNYDGAYMNLGGERSRMYYGERYGMTGVADVFVPLILGGLIVFSTMLGSIIDREREIYTFSALGLAPKNIAMLFFVEAAIYAVLGGFGGYLFSQAITSFVLEPLAQRGIFAVPEMNYSSSTVINTILVVMATVIISTIYPAIQAAKRATADTKQHWHLPPPKNDVLEFNFPFTISRYDITGIICFIREHFINHADRTVGKFAADKIEIQREQTHGFAMLRAVIWLQPFDQGISQQFELSASPSEIEEVCEIQLKLTRLSGPPSAWKRSYRVFLGDLRSQFLLWRTLEDDARDHYLTIGEEVEQSLEKEGDVVASTL